MQIDIPFDAALVLYKTTLRQDFPETFKRFENQSTVYVGQRAWQARMKTKTGGIDLYIIRDYFDLWLNAQDLIPEECRGQDDIKLVRAAREAVHYLTRAIDQTMQHGGRPVAPVAG
jgi:hypothetical protein